MKPSTGQFVYSFLWAFSLISTLDMRNSEMLQAETVILCPVSQGWKQRRAAAVRLGSSFLPCQSRLEQSWKGPRNVQWSMATHGFTARQKSHAVPKSALYWLVPVHPIPALAEMNALKLLNPVAFTLAHSSPLAASFLDWPDCERCGRKPCQHPACHCGTDPPGPAQSAEPCL